MPEESLPPVPPEMRRSYLAYWRWLYGDSPSPQYESFTKRSVVLFIIGVVAVVALVIGGVSFAVLSNQHQVASSQQQWCDTLDLLTRTPVPKPADPKANPSREATYELYRDFVKLKDKFNCV